jgi:hypothetical protein
MLIDRVYIQWVANVECDRYHRVYDVDCVVLLNLECVIMGTCFQAVIRKPRQEYKANTTTLIAADNVTRVVLYVNCDTANGIVLGIEYSEHNLSVLAKYDRCKCLIVNVRNETDVQLVCFGLWVVVGGPVKIDLNFTWTPDIDRDKKAEMIMTCFVCCSLGFQDYAIVSDNRDRKTRHIDRLYA